MRAKILRIVIIVLILFVTSILILLQSLPESNNVIVFEPLYWVEDTNYGEKLLDGGDTDFHDQKGINVSALDIKHPIIIWWTPFTGERGKIKSCDQLSRCFFTIDHHFENHPNTKAFIFYGSDFKPTDLPLPRKPTHEWALLHEESPKNNYLLTHRDVISLFNHTATFQRESDYPLTMQYLPALDALRSNKYLIPTDQKGKNGLAPLMYLHMDCDPPSDRDTYVKELMKFIDVDSYGICLHNKDLPKHLQDPLTMDHKDLYKLTGQYKFTLAFENAICDDYITEKLWRPLIAGSVPVYHGSPSVKDWLPDEHAAILASDFEYPEDLAKYLLYLNSNDLEYEKYLNFKRNGIENKKLIIHMAMREWGINDPYKINFVTGFECFVCNRIHENIKRVKSQQVQTSHVANMNHLKCPKPNMYNFSENHNSVGMYQYFYDQDLLKAKTLIRMLKTKRKFSKEEFRNNLKILQEGE